VSDQPSVYVASVTNPQGIAVSVNPSTLTVAPGKSATFEVTITRTDAEYRTWTFGSLTWADLRGHTVRSPIGAVGYDDGRGYGCGAVRPDLRR
jgi:hypothetical protein